MHLQSISVIFECDLIARYYVQNICLYFFIYVVKPADFDNFWLVDPIKFHTRKL